MRRGLKTVHNKSLSFVIWQKHNDKDLIEELLTKTMTSWNINRVRD